MAKTQKFARLHEFCGLVAFYSNDTPTIYFTPAMALKISKELALAADQIKNANHYQSTEIRE